MVASSVVVAKLLSMLKALYDDTKCTVRIDGRDSTAFNVNTGVRQGAIASPVLFNFAIDWVMKQAVSTCTSSGNDVGITLGGLKITDLDYADDIALLADCETDMQFFLDQVIYCGKMVGLQIDPDKSKIMNILSPAPRIIAQGIEIESVSSFRYLGSLITVDISCEADVLARIGFARAAFEKLHNALFSREDISIQTKMRVRTIC